MWAFIRNLKNKTLVPVAIGGFIGVSCMHFALSQKLSSVANQENFVLKAVEHTKQQQEVINILGPFEIGRANVRDGWSKVETNHVKLRLPMKGEKDNGQLFTYAKRIDDLAPLQLYKIEVKFDSVVGKKLILYEQSDEALKESVPHREETEKERLIRLRRDQAEKVKGNDQQKRYLMLQEQKSELKKLSQRPIEPNS